MEFQILITPHHTFVRKLVGLHTSHNPRQRSRERKRQREGWETEKRGHKRKREKKVRDSIWQLHLHRFLFPGVCFIYSHHPFPFSSWNSQFHSHLPLPPPLSHSLFSFLFLFFFLPQFSGWISGGDYYFKVRFGFWAFSWNGFLLLFLFFLFSHNSVKLSCFGSEFRVGFMGLIQISIIWNTRVWFCLILCHMQPPSLNAHNLLDFIFNFWYFICFFFLVTSSHHILLAFSKKILFISLNAKFYF